MKIYTLWETRSRNMVADFDNEHDALALVWENIELNGPEIAESLALDVEDEEGEGYLIASGQELAELARQKLRPTRVAG